MSVDLAVFGSVAEKYGSDVADRMLNDVLNSADQAEAVGAVMKALNDAFNLLDDPVKERRIAGFAVGIVNVLERGLSTIREESEADHAPA